MRILVIGGTRFVGRHIAQTALDRGHDVTLFNRGRSDPQALPAATHLAGDRNSDLSALADGEWDATIDVSAYVARQVRSLLDALGGRAGHTTFISTISVFDVGRLPRRGFTEEAPLLEPSWAQDYDAAKYGELKVACELAVAEAATTPLIIRPGFVIGPGDNTERFTHWVREVAAGKAFDAPDPDQPLQGIDARDLAAFTVAAVEHATTGTFDLTAPAQPPTFSQVFDTIAAALDVGLPEITWSKASAALPLSLPREAWPMMHADVSKAVDAGLTWRPLAQTVRDLADHIGLRTA
ncbi:MAG TPA: NAD-dependent epimerase/dehydratase family protein [Mycobacteriales bacterium]|nr:NAD-dependent epimerase/dehydratase family protein [Mycobacteriales bacterium]